MDPRFDVELIGVTKRYDPGSAAGPAAVDDIDAHPIQAGHRTHLTWAPEDERRLDANPS